MKISNLRNGVLFVCAGFVLLLNTLDKLDWSVWGQILSLWPVLLIAIGIELLFKRTPLSFLAMLSPVLMLVAILGPVYFYHNPGQIPAFVLKEYKWSEKPDSVVTKATVILDISKGQLEISSNQDNLIQAELKYWAEKPHCGYYYSHLDSSATLEIRENNRHWPDRFWKNMKDNDWNISLSKLPVFDLRVYSAATNADLDLSEIKVEKLRLQTEAGKSQVKLGKLLANVKAIIRGDVSDITILVPEGSGLKIVSDTELSSTNFNFKFNKQNDTFLTDNFQTAQNKIEIDLQGAISSLKIDTY